MLHTYELRHGRAITTTPLEHLMAAAWSSLELPPWRAVAAGAFVGTVEVEVNHGRWIVHCPACPGAALAFEIDHRFVCVDCAAGPYQVAWPDDRDAIERALLLRPNAENRNWRPGETVAELLAEHAEHAEADELAAAARVAAAASALSEEPTP